MFRTSTITFVSAIGVLAMVSSTWAQTDTHPVPLRTPDGQPHISGTFTSEP